MILEFSKLCVGTFAFISLEIFVKGVSEPVFNDQGRITSNVVFAYLFWNYHYAKDTVYR